MLRINSSKHSDNIVFTFENEYKVSIVVGIGAYCTGTYEDGFYRVEVAVIDPKGNFYRMPSWDDDVRGWVTIDQVADLFEEVRKLG